MATVRKVTKINVSKAPAKEEVSAAVVEEKEAPVESGAKEKSATPTKKVCVFCESKNEPHYWDAAALRRFVNDRGRIVSRSRSGACSKHQRRVAREVKHARHLALLPFIVRA